VGHKHLFRKLMGALPEPVLLEDSLLEQEGSSDPWYVYFMSYQWMVNMLFGFQPGNAGIMICQMGAQVQHNRMTFATDASWQDGDTHRSGWIFSVSNDLYMFFPDFQTGDVYECWSTTLPYTPGQPPMGAQGAQGAWRFEIRPDTPPPA
jgi:hypothetical protein